MLERSTRSKTWVMDQKGLLGLTRINISIKIVIFIVLKLSLRVDLGLGLKWSTRVDSSQCINKSGYYHSFKTRLES
jgi:hypothetical protein